MYYSLVGDLKMQGIINNQKKKKMTREFQATKLARSRNDKDLIRIVTMQFLDEKYKQLQKWELGNIQNVNYI